MIEHEMLPQQPPPRVARLLAWLLLAIFGLAALAAVIVQIPETVRCPFVLVPEKGADPIQSPLLAVLQSVNVSEGQEVPEGAELFVLRSDEIRGWQTELRNAQEDLSALQKRIAKLEEFYTAELAIKDEELKQVEQEIGFREKHLANCRDYLARNEKLAAEKLVSEVELLRYRLQVAESEKDLNVAQRSAQQVTLQRRQLEAGHVRQRTEEESTGQKLETRIAALNRQLENCVGDLMSIRAAYHAVVISLPHRNAGGVVEKGGELCQLARVESPLRVRLRPEEAGLPRLAVGQQVRLFFDAFPYQRYGTVTGRLEWISPAAAMTAEGQNFAARATLDQTSFALHGKNRPLEAGMKGEARIRVGSRTAVEYAFEPLRQLREQTRSE